MALGWYVASMVCGALWWSPGQTRPLRGQIVQFTFPLWRSGTAVFLASGSRCVTPRPFIGRDPAATHCAHTRLYYLYQKMWAARVSFIHCSAFGRVLRGRLLARVQRGGVSAVGEPAWSASGRVLALSSLGRTDCCTVYAPLGSSMPYAPWNKLDRITNLADFRALLVWDRLWPGPKTTVHRAEISSYHTSADR